MRIQCLGCGRIIENPNWNQKDNCKVCGYLFRPLPQFPMQNNNNQNYNPLPNIQDLPQMPHVYLSKNGFSMNKPIPQPNNRPRMPQNVNPPVKNNEERLYSLYEKIRIYGFYVLLSLVIGYAAYRIIKLFFGG